MSSRRLDTDLAALLFDVDGTLAETEELHRRAFNESFVELGLDWVWDRSLYRRLLAVTGGKERIRHFIDAFDGRPVLETQSIAILHEIKNRCYANLVAAGALTLRPGVARLLREARRAGVLLAIATTTSLANVEALLAATLGSGGLGWFAFIAAGDAVTAKKPAPDVYRLVLEKLGVKAADCVAFEDSSHGLASARAAGLCTVVTISDYGDAGPFPGALAVVDHLGEPDTPCTVFAGSPLEAGYVDLRALTRWRLRA
jgi:beta-phosphoglucomutase-like phosphatase (HAD superfamily)